MSYTVTRLHTNGPDCWCQPEPTTWNSEAPWSGHHVTGHRAQVSTDEATYVDILPQDNAERTAS